MKRRERDGIFICDRADGRALFNSSVYTALNAAHFTWQQFIDSNRWPWRQITDSIKATHLHFSQKCNLEYPSGAKEGREIIMWTNNGRQKINDCDHAKNTGVSHAFTGFINVPGSTTLQRMYLYHRCPSSFATLDDIRRHPDLDYKQFSYEAWLTMEPEFRGVLSMLNFIYELKDFKQLAKFAHKLDLTKLLRVAQQMKRKVKKIDQTKNAAEVHLMYGFAIKPLIADLINIHSQIWLIASEAQRLFQLEGCFANRRHYSQSYVFQEDLVPDSNWYFGQLLNTKLTATLDYKYQYKSRTNFGAFTRWWGLDINLETIWNALPWSFLVDYAFNVGETFKLIRRDAHLKVDVLDYCESIKTSHTLGYHISDDQCATEVGLYVPGVSSQGGYSFLSGTESSLYSRKRTLPIQYGSVSPKFSWASKSQLLNVGALLRTALS